MELETARRAGGEEPTRAGVVDDLADGGEAAAGPRPQGTWAGLRAAVAVKAGKLETGRLREAFKELGTPEQQISVACSKIPVYVPKSEARSSQRVSRPSPELLKALRSAVECELLVPSQHPDVVCSHHFVTPKSDGTGRLIADLREVNDFLDPKRFRLIQLRELPGSVKRFLAKADLTKAFWQVPVGAASQNLMGVDFEGQRWVYKGLPMGLSISPSVKE